MYLCIELFEGVFRERILRAFLGVAIWSPKSFYVLPMDRNKQKELPRIDLPELWIAGTDIDQNLLGLYTDFPVRLKCEMFILCLGGEVDASVNLNSIHEQIFEK